MKKVYNGREDIELQLKRRQSRRVEPIVITDLDFADGMALVNEEIEHMILDILQEQVGQYKQVFLVMQRRQLLNIWVHGRRITKTTLSHEKR